MKSKKKFEGVTRHKTFSERVVELALMIPKGRVTTYGHIARAAGGGGQAARSVTAILGKAYVAGMSAHAGVTQIPFHRIVYAGGRVWLSDEYRSKRMKLYKEEGIELDAKGYIKDFVDILYEFK
jgi:methylated-DNA-protein-cysteine methyltransferase-like protein